jgi:hypothetical protein
MLYFIYISLKKLFNFLRGTSSPYDPLKKPTLSVRVRVREGEGVKWRSKG